MDIEIFEVLNIPEGSDCCVIEPPDSFPDGLDFTDVPNSTFDCVQVFVKDPDLYAEEVAEGERICREDGNLWVATPKAAEADFTDQFVQQQLRPLGLRPTESIELDDEWNATRLEIVH